MSEINANMQKRDEQMNSEITCSLIFHFSLVVLSCVISPFTFFFVDIFSVSSYYHNTISDCKKASFPPKSGNEAFDPYSDPDCENSLWKQWRQRC